MVELTVGELREALDAMSLTMGRLPEALAR